MDLELLKNNGTFRLEVETEVDYSKVDVVWNARPWSKLEKRTQVVFTAYNRYVDEAIMECVRWNCDRNLGAYSVP